MTPQQIKELEKRRDDYINTVGAMFTDGNRVRGIILIYKIVECELLLEAESNK